MWGVVVGHLVVDDDDEVLDVEAARLVRGWGWGWGWGRAPGKGLGLGLGLGLGSGLG